MPKSIQHFPQEIPPQIFHQLSKQDAYECMFVCKSWLASASQRFYEEITLSDQDIGTIKLLEEDSIITQLLTLCQCVKTLNISSRGDDQRNKSLKLNSDEFALLLSKLPNLNTITFDSISAFTWYAIILYSVKDCLDSLQNVSVPIADATSREMLVHTINAYFSICYKYRKTVSSLTFFNLHHLYYNLESNQWGNYFKYLPEFKQLTRLSLYNDANYGGEGDLAMIKVLNICPQNLAHFGFHSNFSVPDSIAEDMLMSMLLCDLDSKDDIRSAHSSVYCKTKLKTLNLSLPSITRPYMMYIISYIPAQLDIFHLVMTDEDLNFDGWVQQGDEHMATVLKFARHLSSVKNLDIYMNKRGREVRFFEENAEARPLRTGVVISDKVYRFWSFVGAIKGTRNLRCHVYFTIFDPASRINTEPTFHIQIKYNQEMNIEFGLDFNDYFDYQIELPPIKLATVGGRAGPAIVNSLTLRFEIGFIADSTKIISKLLHYILNSYPHLVELGIDFRHMSYSFLFKSSTISHKEKTDSSNATTAQDNIDQITIFNSTLESALLTTLSESLPNIKYIAFEGCRFSLDQYDYTPAKRPTVDLSKFEKLEHLELNIRNAPTRDLPALHLQFEFSENGEKSVWYQAQETYFQVDGKENYTLMPLAANCRILTATSIPIFIIRYYQAFVSTKLIFTNFDKSCTCTLFLDPEHQTAPHQALP